MDTKILLQRRSAYPRHKEPRETAFWAEKGVTYIYGGKEFPGKGIPDWLKPYVGRVDSQAGYTHNFILINHYRYGNDYIPPHADDEEMIGPEPGKNRVISSLTLLQGPGQPRLFRFRYKDTKRIVSDPRFEFNLTNGSLLIMKGQTQELFLHEIVKTKKVVAPRLNLTLRVIV